MSRFGNLNTDGLEESEDRLGGFSVFESDIYTGVIKVAYAGQSAEGAQNVTLILDFGGREYRETVYVTNKKGENWFVPKDKDGKEIKDADGKKPKRMPLPGFTTIDDICLIASDKPLAEQTDEEKMVKIYDYDLKKEVPKSVPVLTDLTGQKVSLAISKVIRNKAKKGSDGKYNDIAETREENAIEKAFDPTSKMNRRRSPQG
jgi:hypothetical protein